MYRKFSRTWKAEARTDEVGMRHQNFRRDSRRWLKMETTISNIMSHVDAFGAPKAVNVDSTYCTFLKIAVEAMSRMTPFSRNVILEWMYCNSWGYSCASSSCFLRCEMELRAKIQKSSDERAIFSLILTKNGRRQKNNFNKLKWTNYDAFCVHFLKMIIGFRPLHERFVRSWIGWRQK